jgi:hypothetical protein
MNEWVRERIRELEALRHREVVGWRGVEMALRERGDDGYPVFSDQALPVLQLHLLDVQFAKGAALQIATYQDDDEWGLRGRPAEALREEGWVGIFRCRDLAELPCGVVADVKIEMSNRSNIARIRLSIGSGDELVFVAGEAHEHTGGTVRFVRNDESVLVFRSPADEAAIPWIRSRP